MNNKLIYTVLKYTYITLSLIIILLIMSLLNCSNNYKLYINFLSDKCITIIQISIFSLLFINIIIGIYMYYINRNYDSIRLSNTDLYQGDLYQGDSSIINNRSENLINNRSENLFNNSIQFV